MNIGTKLNIKIDSNIWHNARLTCGHLKILKKIKNHEVTRGSYDLWSLMI